jgi:hypothetical protein
MAYLRDDIRTYYKGYSSKFKSIIRVGVCRNQLALFLVLIIPQQVKIDR